MAKKRFLVIVEIGLLHLKIVAFDAVNDKLLLAAVKDLPSKVKEDKKEFIVSVLKETLPQDILRHAVTILCLSDDSIHIKLLELPRMPTDEILEALKWRVKGIVPFDIDKAVLDFDIIGESTEEDGAKKYNILMVAAPKDIIDEKVSLLKEGGLDVVGGANVDSFGLSNIISLMPEGKKDSTCAVLKVDYKRSTVNIYREGRLTFVRNIPMGLDRIKDSIKGPITSDTGLIELTPADIDKLKSIGIPDNKDILLDGKLQGKHLLALTRPVLESLCNEIGRSLDYYNVQLEGKKTQKIYLMGDGSKYKNLDIFIKDTTGIETDYLELPSSFIDAAIKKEKITEIMPQIISLVGIARLGIDAKVNLLPLEYRVEKVQKVQKISIRMVGFTALAILIVSFVLVNVRVKDYERRLVSVKSHRKILQKINVLYDKILQREELLGMVRSKDVSSTLIMKELSNIIPDSIVLNNLMIDQRANILKLDGVVHLGSAVSEVVLTDFMEAMEKSPFFKEVNLESSQKDVVNNKRVALFTISCAIQR